MKKILLIIILLVLTFNTIAFTLFSNYMMFNYILVSSSFIFSSFLIYLITNHNISDAYKISFVSIICFTSLIKIPLSLFSNRSFENNTFILVIAGICTLETVLYFVFRYVNNYVK